MKENGHEGVKFEECGLFVGKSKVFLGASPDGLVSCSCCDETGLEGSGNEKDNIALRGSFLFSFSFQISKDMER